MAVHLYIALPLLLCALRPRLLGFRRRLVLTLAAAVVAGSAWRYWSASRISFFLPIRDRRLPEEEANLNTLLDAVYLPTLSRVTELAVGASLGLLLRSPSAISWVICRCAAHTQNLVALHNSLHDCRRVIASGHCSFRPATTQAVPVCSACLPDQCSSQAQPLHS